MEYLFETIRTIFKDKSSNQSSFMYIIFIEIFISVNLLSQQSLLFWYAYTEIKDWNKYQTLWNVMGFLSLDNLAATYSYLPEFVMCTISIISITSAFFLLILVLKCFHWKICWIIIYITRMLLTLLCEVYFITTANILEHNIPV